jgi:hypothetical protein
MRDTQCPCSAYGANPGKPAVRRRPVVEAGFAVLEHEPTGGELSLRGTLRHDHAHPSVVITRIGHCDRAFETPSGQGNDLG